jgi:cell division protein FtsW (lipid II flippase)
MGASTRYVLAGLPALIVGIVVIVHLGGGPGRLALYLGCAAAGMMLIAVTGRRRPSSGERPSRAAWSATGSAAVGVIASTFLFAGRDGVYRWVALGPFQLNASLLLSPVVIVVVHKLFQEQRTVHGLLMVAALQAVHIAQPDAAQATAVAAATVAVFALGGSVSWSQIVAGLASVAAAVAAWSRRDPLTAAPGVEDVLQTVFDLNAVLGLFAVGALVVLVVPFVSQWRADRLSGPTRNVRLVLGAYLAGMICASQVGAFPVPIMGFGASTVLSYYCAAAAALASARADAP